MFHKCLVGWLAVGWISRIENHLLRLKLSFGLDLSFPRIIDCSFFSFFSSLFFCFRSSFSICSRSASISSLSSAIFFLSSSSLCSVSITYFSNSSFLFMFLAQLFHDQNFFFDFFFHFQPGCPDFLQHFPFYFFLSHFQLFFN